ncbi:hypothetical protein MycrhDRAFT_3350 [Mycolicibacterium rhodesiae JS60]|nr:hypothetical protein MycrhDRAFT_3350 [Mycolicibacterium rhodesiae JS60]
MPPVREGNLAWALIEAVKPHLTARESTQVFVVVGAGDTFAAIRGLIRLAAAKKIPLRPRLVQLCATWLDTYTLHEEYEGLRRMIEDCLMPNSVDVVPAISQSSALSKSMPRPPTVTTGYLAPRLPAPRSADSRV